MQTRLTLLLAREEAQSFLQQDVVDMMVLDNDGGLPEQEEEEADLFDQLQ